jgi:hypothetical protein
MADVKLQSFIYFWIRYHQNFVCPSTHGSTVLFSFFFNPVSNPCSTVGNRTAVQNGHAAPGHEQSTISTSIAYMAVARFCRDYAEQPLQRRQADIVPSTAATDVNVRQRNFHVLLLSHVRYGETTCTERKLVSEKVQTLPSLLRRIYIMHTNNYVQVSGF